MSSPTTTAQADSAPPVRATDLTQPSPLDAMPAAKPPVGTGSAPLFAQLIALGLIALGVVAIQEALVRTGAIRSASWTSAAVDAVDGLRAAAWVLVLGAMLVVLGVLLLMVVFKPRPRKAVTLSARTGVYLRTRDLSRIAGSVVDGVDAVTGVSVSATRTKVHVTATTVAGKERNASIADDVRTRLSPTLGALENAPLLKVTVKNEGPS